MRTAFTFLIGVIVLITVGCSEDEIIDTDIQVPATYSFSRDGNPTVNYSGQTQRLDMLQMMVTYMKTANVTGSELNSDQLKNMFRNQGAPFTGAAFSKNLISKCFASDTTMLLGWMDEIALNSSAQAAAIQGVAGVLVDGSPDPTRGYLVNSNGIELGQVITKTLMGSVFYYQAMEVYLTNDRMGELNNDQNEEGENYTKMEHNFDEAFGYFGIPIDFPDPLTLEEIRFWGEYCSKRNDDSQAGINLKIMTAFKTARTVIVNKKYTERDAAIATLSDLWAVVIGSTAKNYLSGSLSSTGIPVYKKHHELSEAIGFMHALKYHFENGDSKTSPNYNYTLVEQALNIIGMQTDLYTVTDSDIEAAISKLDQAFPNSTL